MDRLFHVSPTNDLTFGFVGDLDLISDGETLDEQWWNGDAETNCAFDARNTFGGDRRPALFDFEAKRQVLQVVSREGERLAF